MSNHKSLLLREIEPGDKVAGLSLGDPSAAPLKTFLRRCAKEFHHANVAKSYVLVPEGDNPRVLGYITLICSEIKLDGNHEIDDCGRANRYKDSPAVKIARLAIDRSIQRSGYGSALVQLAISIAQKNIMPNIGCRFLITEAKPHAINFYQKTGFTLLMTNPNQRRPSPLMFLDLHKLTNTTRRQ